MIGKAIITWAIIAPRTVSGSCNCCVRRTLRLEQETNLEDASLIRELNNYLASSLDSSELLSL